MNLGKAYIHIGFQILKQYPLDMILSSLSMLLRDSVNFVAIITAIIIMGDMGKWHVYEIVFLYSFSMMVEALSQVFFDAIWYLGAMIRKGKLDIILIRPAGSLFQFFGSKMQLQASLSFLVSFFVLVFSIVRMDYVITGERIIYFMFFLFFCTILNSSILGIFNCANFWLVNAGEISSIVYKLRDFSKYPVFLFPVWIINIITYVIPFAVTSYYPTVFLLFEENYNIIGLLIGETITFFGVFVLIWKKGIESYSSTGT
mgnify:CR=1 FL=1